MTMMNTNETTDESTLATDIEEANVEDTPIMAGEASFPTVAEVRNDTDRPAYVNKKQRCFLYAAIGGGILLLALIIGLSVGLSNRTQSDNVNLDETLLYLENPHNQILRLLAKNS